MPHGVPKKGFRKTRKPQLTDKQERFIAEYLFDGNATQAVLRSGYSQDYRSARFRGVQNLARAYVRRGLQDARAELSRKTLLTAEWVETRLMQIAERCMQAEPVVDKEGNPTGEYRFDSSGANRALELLGRRLRLWDAEAPAQPVNQFFVNAPPQLLLELAKKIREEEPQAESIDADFQPVRSPAEGSDE